MTTNFTKFLSNHPFFKATLVSAITLVLTSGLLISCINGLDIGLRLWGISDEIHCINSKTVQNDDDVARYKELQKYRIEIRDSSVLGYLMVQAGAHFTSATIRLCYLVLVWPTSIAITLWLCCRLIFDEWQTYLKKVQRQKMTLSELAEMYETRAEQLAAKAISLHKVAEDYRKQDEHEESQRQKVLCQKKAHDEDDPYSGEVYREVYWTSGGRR